MIEASKQLQVRLNIQSHIRHGVDIVRHLWDQALLPFGARDAQGLEFDARLSSLKRGGYTGKESVIRQVANGQDELKRVSKQRQLDEGFGIQPHSVSTSISCTTLKCR